MKNLRGGKIILIIVIAAAVLAAWLLYDRYIDSKPAVKIGVLHSLTGTMAASEAPLVDAVRLAVEEANQSGGVNGQPIEMIVADCRSDAAHCAQQAEELITRRGVRALFGCWTSACRKAVKTVVEKHHHLLVYPVQYEGLEQSPDILYTGAAPNQQLVPMVTWALQQHGKRVFLVGSDYVFPRTANRIVRKLLTAYDARLLAERYVPLGGQDMGAIVREIASLRPDFVVNTLNGDSNRHFFQALREAGITPGEVPVFSTSIAEAELAEIGPARVAGHYAAWNYFQSVDSAENRAFVARFRQRFGAGCVLDDPMEAAYTGAWLWVNAMRGAGSPDMANVKTLLAQQTLPAPGGVVAVDPDTMHLWKAVRIGRARADGQFDIVWQSGRSIAPAPFPFFIPHDQRGAIMEAAR